MFLLGQGLCWSGSFGLLHGICGLGLAIVVILILRVVLILVSFIVDQLELVRFACRALARLASDIVIASGLGLAVWLEPLEGARWVGSRCLTVIVILFLLRPLISVLCAIVFSFLRWEDRSGLLL